MNKSRISSAASLMLVLAACGVEQTLLQEKDNADRTLQDQENPSAE